ncbi:glycosyltransferase [Nocardia tengchongensis]|uniref:glycosyltransferase n=1 Tax=Nocardia tengchongensis TaxID=2055889 RepID=UPI0036BF644D
MKVLLAFAGSRGDAQPGVLLGRELLGRGHDVTVAVSPNLVEFAARHGVPAVPFGLDSDELLRAQRDDERFRQLNPVQRLRAVLDLQRRGFGESARDLLAVARGHDIVVTGMACEEVAVEVARHHGIPVAAVHFFPIRPNRSVPVVAAGWGHRIPGPLNRLGWRALTAARARALASEVAALPPAPASSDPVGVPGAPGYTAIQAYDPELFPGLANELRDSPFTGFPVPDATQYPDVEPVASRRTAVIGASTGASAGHHRNGVAYPAIQACDSELFEWLIAGPAPVYAGFGSMPVADPVAVEAMVREAGRRLGLRVLLVGPMFRGRIGAELAVVDQVDHRAVLPLCAAAVHHGGAGTTAAALRAGVPSVICSVQADQPYWGRQVESLGLGATAPFAGLTANRLERLLIRTTEPDVRLRAAAYGARFRDDGVRRAADVVESLAPDMAARDAAEPTAATIGGVR